MLSDSGHTVLVIEANDYVGGRSRTVALDALPGVPTDLGSEWLYEDSDMESELVKRGLVDAAIANDASKTLPYWNVRYYSQSTNKNDAVVAAPLENEDEFSELWGEFVSFVQGLGDVSYADALEQFIKKNNVNGNDEEQYLNLVLDSGELEYAGDTNSMSVSDQPFYFMNEECGSDSLYMSVPGVGFGSTAESFANDLNVEIKLKSKVVGIDYEDRDGDVIISFEENGTTKEVMTRTAVVTVSLGVLQAGTIAFSPNLPDDKQDAIDNMGFGLLNKCVLYWNNEEDMVWPGDYYWFRLVTPEDESSGLFTSFFSPQKLKGIPSLIGWVGGDEAVAMEEQTDDEIMDRVMANLRSMFPTIKDPDEVIITRWAQEENFRGSYSFGKSDRSFQDDASNLKERVGNVWFAGEATNLAGWQATTVGAWDTGEEAAQDMASFLKG